MNWITTNVKEQRINPKLDFDVKFNIEKVKKLNFQEAAIEVSKNISEKFHKDKLYLSFSGGMDSEFILKTFKTCKIPILPILIKSPLNLIESERAIRYCKAENIKLEIIDLSLKQVIREIIQTLIDLNNGTPYGLYPLLLSKRIGNNFLTGNGEPFHNQKTFYRHELFEHDYYTTTLDNCPPPFFSYSPEIFKSMIREMDYNSNSLNLSKSKLYNIEYREKISGYMNPHHHMIERLPFPNRKVFCKINLIDL